MTKNPGGVFLTTVPIQLGPQGFTAFNPWAAVEEELERVQSPSLSMSLCAMAEVVVVKSPLVLIR